MSSNNRASLLAGLRTGGVRSSSTNIPHTAAPTASFNIPHVSSQNYHNSHFPEEDDDQVLQIPNSFQTGPYNAPRAFPMTAAVDGPNNRFSGQQNRGMNPNSVPFSPGFSHGMMGGINMQGQAIQLQMQMEMLKIQAQQQQYQAELFAQAQRQQTQVTQNNRRASMGFVPPATAGPLSTSFDLRSATLSAQMRRANQPNERSIHTPSADDVVPMTAALGGKFGSRGSNTGSTFPRYSQEESSTSLSSSASTTVISGGTSLGNMTPTTSVAPNTPSKSDSVSSWRRGGSKGNSVLAGRVLSSPSVKITPPPTDRDSPSPDNSTPTTAIPIPSPTTAKARPLPLRFSPAVQQPLAAVAIDASDDSFTETENDDGYSSSSSAASLDSGSSPTTPSSNEMMVPLSPREEAAKKLYEGLGIGRPASSLKNATGSSTSVNELQQVGSNPLVNHRLVSQPSRQPRGPPSGMDELTPRNFATRIRRQAIGGLGMLMDARERREVVTAY